MKKRIFIIVSLVTALIAVFSLSGAKQEAQTLVTSEVKSVDLNGIPVIYITPNKENDKKKLVIWIDGFTGNKERTIPYLKDLADNGYTAVSFDKYEHGERGTETGSEIYKRIQSGFKRNFWTILGHSSLDAVSVIDWAIKEFDISDNVCMGGFSMGGDIAVSVAGYDKRVNCVAAVVTSPDWKRPGRKDVSTLATTKKAKAKEKKALEYYKIFDPMLHIDAYAGKNISFELGKDDTLIQSKWALNFEEVFHKTHKKPLGTVRVVLHKDTKHEMTEEMWKNCLAWFNKYE